MLFHVKQASPVPHDDKRAPLGILAAEAGLPTSRTSRGDIRRCKHYGVDERKSVAQIRPTVWASADQEQYRIQPGEGSP